MWSLEQPSWDVLQAALTSEVMGMALLSKTQTGHSPDFTVQRTMDHATAGNAYRG